MEEKVKDYVNSDLANLSYEEFSDKFDTVKPDNTEFIDNLEWALLYLNAEKTASPIRYNEMQNSCFNINTFDGAWLMGMDRLGSQSNELQFLKPFQDQANLKLFKDFNIKIFQLGNMIPDGTTSLQKFRLMDNKELKHLKGIKQIVEYRMAVISKDEKWYTHGGHYMNQEAVSDKTTVCFPIPISIDPNYYIPKQAVLEYTKTDDYKELLRCYNMALNVKLTGYYEWFVYIKENEKSLGVKIPVAPEASKDIFALRDIPEGDARKKAICNFVKSHYRTVKNEYNEEVRQTLVKQHLRGETKFNWRGLQVHIIPAEYDLNRINTKKRFIKI